MAISGLHYFSLYCSFKITNIRYVQTWEAIKGLFIYLFIYLYLFIFTKLIYFIIAYGNKRLHLGPWEVEVAILGAFLISPFCIVQFIKCVSETKKREVGSHP